MHSPTQLALRNPAALITNRSISQKPTCTGSHQTRQGTNKFPVICPQKHHELQENSAVCLQTLVHVP